MASKKSKPTAEIIDLDALRAAKIAPVTLERCWELYKTLPAYRLLRESTRRNYRAAMQHFIENLSPKPDYIELKLYHDTLAAKKFSTANNRYKILKAVIKEVSLVAHDVALCRDVKRLKVKETTRLLPRCPSDATVKRLFELATTRLQKLALLLGMRHGLRLGEMLGIQMGDVKRQGNTYLVTIRTSRNKNGVGPRKNSANGWHHIIEVTHPITMSLLEEMTDSEIRKEEILSWRPDAIHNHNYLLPCGPHYLEDLMNTWRKDPQVDLPVNTAWHGLRHYGATRKAEAGAMPYEIMKWLGDNTPAMTLIYIAQTRGTTIGSDNVPDILDSS